MKLFTSMDTGVATLEAVRLKMVKKLLSGDTVRIVANGSGIAEGRDLKKQKFQPCTNAQ